jgi:Ion channel
VIDRDTRLRFRRLQERLGDPLLTTLTILLALLLFVVAPFHAAGIVASQDVGLAVALVVIVAVLFAYGISAAVVVMLVGFGLAVAATVLRHRHQTPLDLYLDATAWILLGLALSWVVARAVFAPGRITYHRIMGAILLYLTIGVTFVALYTFVGLLIPGSFSGMSLKDSPTFASTMIYFSFGTLTTAGSADISPLHPIARSLTNVEAMIGQLYPATLLARIVTLEIEGEKA